MPNDQSGRMNRRQFVQTTGLGALALATGSAGTPSASSETIVSQLYDSLSEDQRSKVTFRFDHPLRSKIDNNWHITPHRIGDFFSADQQAMIRDIFRGLHNPDFYDKVEYHIQEDAGGLKNYSIALFGEPGTGRFEFVLTGRHCTARCDGDSVEGAAFGGPILYGHAANSFNEQPHHPDNVYWYQAKRANEVYQALDGKQRQMALLGDPRPEQATATIALNKRGEVPGIPLSELSRDQKGLVEAVLDDLILPFRKEDREEVMKLIRDAGGIPALSMSFYKNMDIGSDGVWDVWQLESPTMLWHFRGAPHVHTWVNVRQGT